MNIGITLKETAYTPEAYAYAKYLIHLGYQVQLDYTLDPDNDLNIYFLGIRPFWKEYNGRAKEVHEYQSLSTPPYAHLKNFTKKIINRKPVGRIFLNDSVRINFNFKDNIPSISRDMGVDEALFQKPSENPDYDILYCGSVAGRAGLIETLMNLAKSYRIILVGKVTEAERLLLQHQNITLMGGVSRDQLPEIFRNARFGLNFTPDIYPFNIQTSTKTLEYLAAGLGVISNRYYWSETFFRGLNYTPIWIENNFSLDDYIHPNLDVSNFSWGDILSNCKFEEFILGVVNG